MATDQSADARHPSSRPVHVRRAEELPKAILAAGVLVGTGYLANTGISQFETDVFVDINHLPGWLEPVLWGPMQTGSLWAPRVVGGLAWWRWRRWRPAVGAVVTGIVAWQLAKTVKYFVDRGR